MALHAPAEIKMDRGSICGVPLTPNMQRKAERKVAADKSMREGDNWGIMAKRNECFAAWSVKIR